MFQDVPKEFEAQSGVLAGFSASTPIIGNRLQASKNQWINYTYYNLLCLLNYSIDALMALDHKVNALAVKLDSNTKMTLKNCTILDLMLACVK